MNQYLLGIDKSDRETADAIRENHAGEFMVVEAALDQILQGLSQFGSQKRKPDNRLESARLFLITRSFNSLWAATQQLERGYYQQAMTLVRMAQEDQAVVRDAEQNPDILAALLDGEATFRERNLSFRKMAERVSPKAKDVWDGDYGTLSEYGAHPRQASMRMLVTEGPDGELVLRPGSHYDQVWVNMVLYYLLRELTLVFETVAKVTASVGINWVTGAIPILDRIDALWKRIDEWANQQLKELDESPDQPANPGDC